MKSILFALLLLFSTASFAEVDELRVEVPNECMMQVDMTLFVLSHYDQGISKEDFHKFMDEISEHPDAVPEMVVYTRELIELVYGFKPDEKAKYAAIFDIVIERCLFEADQRREKMPV